MPVYTHSVHIDGYANRPGLNWLKHHSTKNGTEMRHAKRQQPCGCKPHKIFTEDSHNLLARSVSFGVFARQARSFIGAEMGSVTSVINGRGHKYWAAMESPSVCVVRGCNGPSENERRQIVNR